MSDLGRQCATLARASGQELIWGLRSTSREVARWQTLASEIRDPRLREDALAAIARKRGNIHGAALFWTLPPRREPQLLRTLVAWEVLADYLDRVNERSAARGIANGRQLHLALSEALQPEGTISDYYCLNSADDDSGYAEALVKSCRAGCAQLPSYERAAPLMLRAAELTFVLAINHEPDPRRRERELRDWAARELPNSEQRWFERTAGASAWLTVLAMLALAAQPADNRRGTIESAEQTYDAYLRWVCPAGAMLDSYGDVAEDEANGDHSYIAHYPSLPAAVQRIAELIAHARSETAALPQGERHTLILACMTAFYLSKDSAQSPPMRASTRKLLAAGGPLTQLLTPVLRLWRTAYGQRAA